MAFPLEKHPWWNYIHEDLRELLKQSTLLIDIFEREVFPKYPDFHDYSFVAFPAAKAYEGFLKTLFKDLGFINEEDFYGKRFRIGKALNPELEKVLRKEESVYDRIVSFCGGKDLANVLWETWKRGRNSLFHWFPNEKNAISFVEAKQTVESIFEAMDLAFESCKAPLPQR